MNHVQSTKIAELPATSFGYRLEDPVRLERIAMVVDDEEGYRWIPPYYFTNAAFDFERAITLSSIAEIEQFARYLLSEDHPQRCSYVKELAIHCRDGFPEACASMLVQVLKKCTQLERLVLPFAEFLVTEDRRFFDAICSLTSLKHLAMRSAGRHSLDVIKNIQSPIQSLVIDRDHDDDFVDSPRDHIDYYNPSEEFRALCSTLTMLRMPWPPTRKEDMEHTIRWIPPVPLKAYPLVSSLDVFGWNLCHTDVLMPMFPNLKHLRVLHDRLHWELGPRDLRAENIPLQAMSPVQWDSLESLEGIMSFVYPLAISCPVKTLRLYRSFDCRKTEDAQRFLDTVTAAAPSNLMISVTSCMLLESQLIETLRSAEWNQLCIAIDVKQYKTLEDIMERVMAVLKGVTALHLEISFIWGRHYIHPLSECGPYLDSEDDEDGDSNDNDSEENDDNDGDEEDTNEGQDNGHNGREAERRMDQNGYVPLDPIIRDIFNAIDLSTLGSKLSTVVSTATEVCVAKALFMPRRAEWDKVLVEDHDLKWHVDHGPQAEGGPPNLILSDKIMLQWTDPYKGWFARLEIDE